MQNRRVLVPGFIIFTYVRKDEFRELDFGWFQVERERVYLSKPTEGLQLKQMTGSIKISNSLHRDFSPPRLFSILLRISSFFSFCPVNNLRDYVFLRQRELFGNFLREIFREFFP